jgi:hypothetical protein
VQKITTSGTPEIVAAESTETGTSLVAPIVTPEPLSNSFGGVVRGILDQTTEAALIIVDANTRKITSATGAAMAALIAAVAASGGDACTLTPTPGQTGRSLEWGNDGEGDLNAGGEAAVLAAVSAAKPKRSVESLVNSIVGAEYGDAETLPVVLIDQASGYMKVYTPATGAAVQTAIDAVANAGDRAQIELVEPQSDAVAGSQVFEGGAV